MANVFRFPYTIALYDTDAAGLIFYANLFRMCQQVYEALLAEIGYSLPVLFERRTLHMPVVHAECDFEQRITVGMKIEIRAHVERIGNSSYRIVYEFWSASGQRLAIAATVQVCVDPKSGESIPVPEDFRKALLNYA